MTALARLKRHVDRYGPESVMETGAESLDFDELCELQRHVDEDERRRQGRWAKNHRLSVEERVRRLLGVEEEVA